MKLKYPDIPRGKRYYANTLLISGLPYLPLFEPEVSQDYSLVLHISDPDFSVGKNQVVDCLEKEICRCSFESS